MCILKNQLFPGKYIYIHTYILAVFDIIINKALIKSSTLTGNLHINTLSHLILKTKIQGKRARRRMEPFSLTYIGKQLKTMFQELEYILKLLGKKA